MSCLPADRVVVPGMIFAIIYRVPEIILGRFCHTRWFGRSVYTYVSVAHGRDLIMVLRFYSINGACGPLKPVDDLLTVPVLSRS